MESIEPLAIGTAEGESLSSFVQRLCRQNGGMPGQLVFRQLSWLDKGRRDRVGAWSPRPGRLRIGFNNNCFSLADVWVRVICQLTGRADLPQLTTRGWDHLFPTRGFAHGSLCWCARCLGRATDPYHPLAWMVQPVRVCVGCCTVLQRHCVRCGRKPPVLHDRSHITRCPWCAGDLRAADESLPIVPRDHFDFWAATEVGAIIAAAGQCHRTFRWDPQRAFRAICTEHRLTPGAFARAIGTGKLTTWCWLNGKTRPSLGSALRVYHRFGLSLIAALIGEAHRRGAAPDARQGEIHLRSRRRPRQIDWPAIQRKLNAELGRPISAAPTLLAVSEQLDIARRTLRAHEPVLCRQIASRHRERVRLEAAKRAEVLAAQIRAAVRVFHSQGLAPTWRELGAAMGRPNLFNSAYARQVVRPLVSNRPSVPGEERYVENSPHSKS